MIRVASLKDMVQVNYTKKDIAGMTPGEQLSAISKKTHELVHDQYDVYGKLISKLSDNGIHLISHYEELDDRQERYVNEYFRSEVYIPLSISLLITVIYSGSIMRVPSLTRVPSISVAINLIIYNKTSFL